MGSHTYSHTSYVSLFLLSKPCLTGCTDAYAHVGGTMWVWTLPKEGRSVDVPSVPQNGIMFWVKHNWGESYFPFIQLK